MNDALTSDPGPVLSDTGPASAEVNAVLRNDARTEPLLASFFWSVFTETEYYHAIVARAGVLPEVARPILVSHASGTRHDLLVLVPAYREEAKAINLESPLPEVRTVLETHRQSSKLAHRLKQNNLPIRERTISAAVAEVARSGEFGIVLMELPREIETCVPSPPIAIEVQSENLPVASVGVVLRKDGSVYATTALHAIRDPNRIVKVGSTSGVLVKESTVTDSCVLKLKDDVLSTQETIGHGGPLTVIPAPYSQAKFDGMASGLKRTTVTGTDLSVVDPQQYIGSKLYTSPDTIPGDSGAALIDDTDRLLGFACSRSSFDSPVGYSTWVWAHQVLAIHELLAQSLCKVAQQGQGLYGTVGRLA
jgi:hypothetical protein